ncbi:MAG TPA: SPFH domain-containing protein [Steroidobacteraceae bacterium]|nr:SPFH domain-containing protein [Steroidobacteraceae bacterium]
MNQLLSRDTGPRFGSVPRAAPGVLLAIIVVLVLLFSSWFVVPPANVAFTRWLGGTVMQRQPLGPGLHLKVPFMESVDEMQVSQSVYTLAPMEVYTNDNQSVTIAVSLIYVVPAADVYHLLYEVGRTGNVDVDGTVLPVVRNDAQAVFARYNTLTISDRRAEIADAMQVAIAGDLRRLFGLEVVNVQLTGIQYSGAFTQSVEAAMTAKAAAVQAQNQVLQKQYEGQQAVVLAEAQAKAKIATAEGDARAIALVGDALRQNPAYIRWYEASRWDGVLPKYVAGKAAVPVIDADK